MVDVYWSCLIGGIAFAVITFLAGESFGNAVQSVGRSVGADALDLFHPATLVSMLTAFGGVGVLLSEYTSITGGAGVALSALSALALGAGLHLLYVRPMRRGAAVALAGLRGELGSVTIEIPAHGYGEVTIRTGTLLTSFRASSLHGQALALGQLVVVVDVRDETLMVAPVDDGGVGETPLPVRPRATLVE
jgi:hypothetical protein